MQKRVDIVQGNLILNNKQQNDGDIISSRSLNIYSDIVDGGIM